MPVPSIIPRMRIREGELQAIAAAITRALEKQGSVRFAVKPHLVQARIVELLARNFEAAQALEAEAERMAETHTRQLPGMDFRKIVQGIMERLARDRGFPL